VTLIIRPFMPADHATVMELWCTAWEAVYPEIDFRARWPGMLARWDEMVEQGSLAHVAVAYVSSRDLARAADDPETGEIAGFTMLDLKRATLDQIAVATCHWGGPVARALMLHAKTLSPQGLTLNVNQSNARAVRFYEREGFVRIGEGVNARSGMPVWEYRWRG
jgi:putative acetyltransferase